MTPEDRQHFDELLLKAQQSGKQETSDLVDDIMRRVDIVVEKSIEKYVNGKIRAIDTKIDTYIREDAEFNDRMKSDTDQWRATADKSLEFVKNTTAFGKVFMYLVGVFIAIGTLYKVIKF